jgi:hypothetical protein
LAVSISLDEVFIKRVDEGDIPVILEGNHFGLEFSQRQLDPFLVGIPSIYITSVFYLGVRLINNADRFINHGNIQNPSSRITATFSCGFIRRPSNE